MMGKLIKVHEFKDGKVIGEDRIAYANGEYVSYKDYEKLADESSARITQLNHDLEKTYNQFMETEKETQQKIAELEKTRGDWADNAVVWREKCEKAEKKIKELESELETKENLSKIKNRLCGNSDELPIDPVEVVQMLINATYERKPNAFEKFRGYEGNVVEVKKYSTDDLEQIAEHLLVHCKHNRGNENDG